MPNVGKSLPRRWEDYRAIHPNCGPGRPFGVAQDLPNAAAMKRLSICFALATLAVLSSAEWTSAAAAPVLEFDLNSDRFHMGNPMTLTITVRPAGFSGQMDLYLAILPPGMGLLFLQADGTVSTDPRPFLAGWTVQPLEKEVARYTLTGAEPAGDYAWFGAFVLPGTTTIAGDIIQAPFTVEPVVFSDDFNDGTADDWTVVAGQWAVQGGEFVESSDTVSDNIAVHGPDLVDFLVTAEVRSGDDDDVGLVFRFQDADNYYVVTLNDQKDRILVRRRRAGQSKTLANVSANPYIRGVPVELGVLATQAHLQVFVNGRTVLEADTDEVTSGGIGLYSKSNKFAAFDNVLVMAPDALKPIRNNVIYVDARNKGGTEDGQSPATAWGSIAAALQDPRFQNSSGSTIVVAAGVYFEQVDVTGKMSGIPGAFNTIRAADGAQVVVDGEKDTDHSRREAVLVHTGVAYVRLEGLTLRNAQHRCLLVFDSGPAEIVGNHLHDCGDSGLEFWYGARQYEVARNVIDHNEGDGIVLSQGTGTDTSRFKADRGIVIRNNVIAVQGPAGGNGIFVDGAKPHIFAIQNNTIAGNLANGIYLQQGLGGGDVRNNLVVGNAAIGFKNFADLPNDYNDLFGNGASGNANYDNGPLREHPGLHTLGVDPLFANALAGDLRLRAGSPCIDAGDPDPRYNDPDGTRNDMGAYGGPLVGPAASPLP